MPTVALETATVSYTGSGTTGPFTVPFYFLEDSHLLVVKETIATGVRATLVLTTEYTVSGADDSAGGTVTLIASLSSAYKLHVERNVPITQTSAYPRNDPFPAATHERAVNKLTMIDQQLSAKLQRALLAPVGETPEDLPSLVDRASMFLAFDSDGDPIASSGTGTDSGLRVDLASTGATPGAALLGVKESVTGAAATTLSAYLNLKVKGLRRTFGAVGDGVTNDYTQIAAAWNSGKIIEVEDGTFLFNTGLPAPLGHIVGYGLDVSILKPGASVVKAFPLQGQRNVCGITLDGALTTDCTGFKLGDSDNWYGLLADVKATGFAGTSGYACHNYKTLKTAAVERFTFSESHNGLLVSGTGGLPTTTLYANGVLTDNDFEGAYLANGYSITFDCIDFESNGKEGVKLLTTGDLVEIAFVNGCWFEDNWTTIAHTSSTRADNFHFRAGDGTTGMTCRFLLDGAYFAVVYGAVTVPNYTPRAILLDGGSVVQSIIRSPRFASEVADAVSLRNSAAAEITEWVQVDYDTVVDGNFVSRYGVKRYKVTTHAKAGATAGWVVNAANDGGVLATVPAGQTSSTLVVRLPGLRVGQRIDGVYLSGRLASAGNTVQVDMALRKLTAAAGGGTDALVANMTQINVTADTLLSDANSLIGGTATVAEGESFYVLITVTTGASCSVELDSVVMKTQGL